MMRASIRAAMFLALCIVARSVPAQSPTTTSLQPGAHTEASHPRSTVFISDLHFGVGRDAQGHWYKIEDARWPDELDLFLRDIDRSGGGATDLILNGDTFELWQSIESDCVYPNAAHQDKNLSCSEADALHRMHRVLGQHGPELAALGRFAQTADNRVVLVPGNHDVALLFPSVAAAALKAIGAPADRLSIATEGYWLSADKLLYAEHGQQIGKEVNRFEGWPKPFVEAGGQRYLRRPWGEQFVQAFYNAYEEKYPIIDNISEEGTGVRYGLAAEGSAGTIGGVSDFLGFFLFKVSWDQFGAVLAGNEDASTWDVEVIKAQGDRFLVESYPTDDPLRAAAERALAEKRLPISLQDLDDDQILAICDHRALLLDMQQKVEAAKLAAERRVPTITSCPIKHLGAISQKLLRTYNRNFRRHLEETYTALASSGKTDRLFRLFVYSHTHSVQSPFTPLAESNPQWNPMVVNTGAWQRVVTPDQLKGIQAKRQLGDAELLRKLEPDDLPACYAAIVVKPYMAQPDPRLELWRKGPDGKWVLAEGPCS
jgi:UDP-2,3-diacylglucosamine pyrophosphatase LpxH